MITTIIVTGRKAEMIKLALEDTVSDIDRIIRNSKYPTTVGEIHDLKVTTALRDEYQDAVDIVKKYMKE